MRARVLCAGLLLVVGLLGCGCHGPAVVDKTGSSVIVLRLASADSVSPSGQVVAPKAFIDALERRSGGRVKASVQLSYEAGAAPAETDIVKAIASGDLDGGWPSTRAFSRAGIRTLEPVEAPFVLTSYAAEKSLATGPEGQALLATLNGTGVIGFGLSAGPLRRPWALKEPLVDLQSWRGVTFRSFNSPVQDDVIRALGAKPVAASWRFPELVRAGSLAGVEFDVAGYARNGYGSLLPNAVGNEVLWPRMLVLTLSQKRFDSLTSEQQAWVRDSAVEAVQASVNLSYDDDGIAAGLCSRGVRFVNATPAQLAALRRAVQPVIDNLSRDPATGPSLSEVQKVAARFPSVDALKVPASCRNVAR
jgi:TRAP-type C4-dicarboxylate transport system substrate-binding protein